MEVKALRIVKEELWKRGKAMEDLTRLRKGDPLKVELAERLHNETPMTLRWIASTLEMGSWEYLSHLLYLRRKQKHHNNKV